MQEKYKAYKKTVSIPDREPHQVFRQLLSDRIGFLLESNDREQGRYTFFGLDPAALITSRGQALEIHFKEGEVRMMQGNPKEKLQDFMKEYQVEQDEQEPPFQGGLVGCLGYDFIRYSEDLPDQNRDPLQIETVQMMLIMEFVVFDHVAETMTAVVLERPDQEGADRAEQRMHALLSAIREAVSGAAEEQENSKNETKARLVAETDTLQTYSDKVNKIKEYVKNGHIFQTVLSQRWTYETEEDGYSLYEKLRIVNPSPYLFFYRFPLFDVIGSSPEMLVKQLDHRIFTCPIAGTRRRGRDEAEDEKLEKELLADEKERAEHAMLVDLARNDMGRVAMTGSVKVTRFMDVQKYSHVMHIVSLVEGKKKKDVTPVELVASFLPAGTLSGAPKIRAMEIIDELEEERRGLYGGAIGYFDFNGNLDFCITIRTMIKKGKKVWLQAGAGIVADSVPESEYRECRNKAMALASILGNEEACK